MIEFFNERPTIVWYIIGIVAGWGLRVAGENIWRGVK